MEKEVYLITWVTHYSRRSERMDIFRVPYGEGVELTMEDEILIMKSLVAVIKSDQLKILAINICGDHVHVVMVCRQDQRNVIVARMKGKSAYEYNQFKWCNRGGNPHVDGSYHDGTIAHLWARKYHHKSLDSDEAVVNAIEYVRNNRIRHNLPNHPTLTILVESVSIAVDEAFREI